MDRDHNAALNILKKGLEIFGIKIPQELWYVIHVDSTDVNEAGSNHHACLVGDSHQDLSSSQQIFTNNPLICHQGGLDPKKVY